MSEQPTERERNRAAQILSEHWSAGRLKIDEYDDRIARAERARTRTELSALFADLPGPGPYEAPIDPRAVTPMADLYGSTSGNASTFSFNRPRTAPPVSVFPTYTPPPVSTPQHLPAVPRPTSGYSNLAQQRLARRPARRQRPWILRNYGWLITSCFILAVMIGVPWWIYVLVAVVGAAIPTIMRRSTQHTTERQATIAPQHWPQPQLMGGTPAPVDPGPPPPLEREPSWLDLDENRNLDEDDSAPGPVTGGLR